MKIKSVYIDQFGGYEKTRINLSEGFSLFFGHNESGKTTLRNFFQQMLFGFPKKASKTDGTYPPFNGGKPSGTIQIITSSDKEYKIQRLDQKVSVLYPDQTLSNQEIDHSLWNGIDKETFRQVFCMDVKDWNGLSLMNKEEMQNRFLSASFGVRSLSFALNQLQKKYKEILTPSGRTQILNKLHKELRETKKKIRDREQMSSEYLQWNDELDSLEDRIREIQKETSILQKEQLQRSLWHGMKNDWVSYQAKKKELEKFPSLFHSVAFSESRLEKARECYNDRENLTESLQKIYQERSVLQQRYTEIAIQTSILEAAPFIHQLVEQKKQYAQAVEDFPRIRLERKKQKKLLHQLLTRIDPQWNEQILQDNIPQTAEEELQIHRWKQDFNNLLQQVKRLEDTKSKNEEDVSVLQRKLQTVDKQIQEEESNLLTSKEYASLVGHYEQCKEFQKQLSYLQQKEWESNLQSRLHEMPSKSILLSLFTLLFVSLSSIVLLPSMAIVRTIGYVVGLGSILFLFYLLGFKKQKPKKSEGADIKNTMRTYCKKHQIPMQSFDNSDITRLLTMWEQTLQNHRDRLQAIARWKETMADLQSDFTRLKAKIETINNQYAEAEQQVKDISQKWEAWKREHHLSNQISIHDADILFSLIKDAQTQLNSLIQYSDRQVLVKSTIRNVQGQLIKILHGLEETVTKETLSAESITNLQKRLSDAEEAAQNKKELDIHIAQLKRSEVDIQERLDIRVKQYHSLLQSYQVSDMEEFELLTKEYQSFQRSKEEQESLFHRLYGKVGNDERWNDTIETLSKIDFQENEDRLLRCQNAIKTLETQINDAVEKRGKLQQKREDLYANNEMEYLQQQKESLENNLQEKAEEWLTYVVAYSLIQKTKSVFEEKQQPGVIRYASDWIYEITDHRYHLMKTSDSENSQESFVLYDTSDTRKTEKEWSDGLADQVYLAIRIGLIYELSEHGETLPLFLDDIFVRFDAARQKKAAKLLLEMSKKHQIFYFTCHTSILHSFQLAAKEIEDVFPSFYEIHHFDLQKLPTGDNNEDTVATLFKQ